MFEQAQNNFESIYGQGIRHSVQGSVKILWHNKVSQVFKSSLV